MKFVFEIDHSLLRGSLDRSPGAQVARGVLEAMVLQNMLLFRARKVPRLYDASVRYIPPEADADGGQHLLSALETCKRGAGTCAPLACWRAAELRVLGDSRIGVAACKWENGGCHHGTFRNLAGHLLPACPGIKIYWRGEGNVMHCEVRLPSGSAEDPSRFLGMTGQRRNGA